MRNLIGVADGVKTRHRWLRVGWLAGFEWFRLRRSTFWIA
jgi:hypothetical protein